MAMDSFVYFGLLIIAIGVIGIFVLLKGRKR